ncbi:MAG: biosynthetic arginine decarboxylase [Candidatus Competibacteraceae bacterium]|nr:biosynthetic arginine decarboxylase [Candidatus Competibacteraceae bacterium]
MNETPPSPAWSVSQARKVYNTARWSEGYFDIDDAGQARVCSPRWPRHPGVVLSTLAEEIRAAGFSLPVLARFSHILHERVDALCDAFAAAIAELDYQGGYTAVYPIKVNQQRRVVSEIVRHGGSRVGLEAGSKPELMAVLGLSAPSGVVVCNGYKDREYIRLALIGQRLGLNVFIVIEKLSELEWVIAESRKLGIAPQLGMRVRLASIGAGKWQNTGGEKSKFGLSASQVLEAVRRLRELGLLDCLTLLHAHLGSQIANIHDIQRGLREVGRYYAELWRLGACLQWVDVGGGLGVDYEGTGSRSDCSMNYSLAEYANNVVYTLWEVCTEQNLPHPHLFSESGRALTAHHAVLITEVIDHEPAPGDRLPPAPGPGDPLILHDLWKAYRMISRGSAVEAYHDAAYGLAEARDLFLHGVLRLEQRARVEQLYFAICRKLRSLLNPTARAHRELLDELNDKLAEKLFLNFSIFQSTPDVWGLEQIFPILPLQGLSEPPSSRVVLQDLTCDSDGCIERYVDGEGVETTLPLPPYQAGSPYLLGIFLVGAYQEILGDMHNLFGDTAAVNVELSEAGGYQLVEPTFGDTVADLLRYVRFEPEILLSAYRQKIGAADLEPIEQAAYLAELEEGLAGYTYLEP